jgi:hypothetical protein
MCHVRVGSYGFHKLHTQIYENWDESRRGEEELRRIEKALTLGMRLDEEEEHKDGSSS